LGWEKAVFREGSLSWALFGLKNHPQHPHKSLKKTGKKKSQRAPVLPTRGCDALKSMGFVEVRGKGHCPRSLWLTAKSQDFLRRYLVLEELLTQQKAS
jgi:hypothetical protein